PASSQTSQPNRWYCIFNIWNRVNYIFSPCLCPHRQAESLILYIQHMELGELYFYTATILNWKPLLQTVEFKQIILDSLVHFVENDKIKVYGFVIMPNHIHLIWENIVVNGKEMPY